MKLEERRRLDGTTLVEPLAGGWPAWWGTVAPIPASLHLARGQLGSLNHYLAKVDKERRGAPLAELPARVNERLAQIQEARQRIETELRPSLEVAEAWQDVQAMLSREAEGQPLQPFYARLPPALKGLVELVYDYHHRPHVRVIEALAYRSPCYRPDLQSFHFSSLEADNRRAFFLTLPRPPRPEDWEWSIRFDDERIDTLFKLDVEAQPIRRILDVIDPPSGSRELVLRHFSDNESPPPARWRGPGLRVRYLGHAGVLVETPTHCVVVDPFLSVNPRENGVPRTTFQDLPATIDYVLVTHAHPDHFVLESLLRLRHRVGTFVVPRSAGLLVGDVSLKLMLKTLGFRSVVELDAMETLAVDGGEIVAVPFLGEHGDLAHSKVGYLVRTERQSLLFAADSACVDDAVYANVRRALGPIDTAFLTTEDGGATLTYTIEALFPAHRDRSRESERRCRGGNAEEGLRLLEILGAKRVFAYALGLEEWTQHVLGPAAPTDVSRIRESERLLKEARARGITAAERLWGPKEILLD